jgi:hypothetical protein
MKCADLDLLKNREWVIGLATHGAFRKANQAIDLKTNETSIEVKVN